MILDELLSGVETVDRHGGPAEIRALAYDSRRASPGALFFAIEGERADGHSFIKDVMMAGAAGVVSERPAPKNFSGVWIRVPKIRRAMAEAGRVFYGMPDTRLKLVGITGTNGKTTTAYLLDSIFRAAGFKTGLFGTIEYHLPGRTVPASHTTPESLDMLEYMAELVQAGGDAAVMEVSSHSLVQERVWGFRFSAAIFTNLTGDHLDYHKNLEGYFAAKRRLFEGEGAPPPELGIINLDDAWAQRFLLTPQPRQITFGVDSNAQVRARHFTLGPEGIRATIACLDEKFDVISPLMGRANVENILAASAAAFGLGIATAQIQVGIAALKNVPGRFERIDEGQPFIVLVDYAHTHDALRNALKITRALTRERVIVVFGCGGDRDRSKRPLMGEAAGAMSDVVVLTSDNPRSEDPILIMNDVMVGLQKSGKPYTAQVDRERGIREALEQARAGDAVLIAGKGHEQRQIFKDEAIHFDDREVARRVLREMGFSKSDLRPE